MNLWSKIHRLAELSASRADILERAGLAGDAREFRSAAAHFEELALAEVAPGKDRTRGITAVSAAALWLKAGRPVDARRVADNALAADLPEFHRRRLADIAKEAAGLLTPNRPPPTMAE